MFNKEELENLLFLVKSVPMDEPTTTQLVLNYIKRIEQEIIKCQKNPK
jgi:hypothetical protein